MDLLTGQTPFQIDDLGDNLSSTGSSVSVSVRPPGRLISPRRPPQQDIVGTDALPAALAANWSKLRTSGLSPKFYSRLMRLASDRFSSAPPPKQEKARSSSLSDFLDFWSVIRMDAVEPDLSLSNDGSIVVEWFKSNDQRLDIKFGETGVLFGLFNKGNVLEGSETKELVASILMNHSARPFQWRANV
jgi:hypothetical protein